MSTQGERATAVGAGDIGVGWGPAGFNITDFRPRPFWAKITGQAAATNRYSWVKVGDSDSTFPSDTTNFAEASHGTTAALGAALEINGSTSVPTNTKVLLYPSPSGTFYIFEYAGSGGISGVTVEELDGSPVYTTITTLIFDQSDGFILTQPALGQTRIDIAPAATTQAGVVNGSAQTWNGTKNFQNGIITVGDATGGSNFSIDASLGARVARTVKAVYNSSDNTDFFSVGTVDSSGTPSPVSSGYGAITLYTGPISSGNMTMLRWSWKDSTTTRNLAIAMGPSGGANWLTHTGTTADGEDFVFAINGGAASAYYAVGISKGITATKTVKDGTGTNQTVTITGGIITGWT